MVMPDVALPIAAALMLTAPVVVTLARARPPVWPLSLSLRAAAMLRVTVPLPASMRPSSKLPPVLVLIVTLLSVTRRLPSPMRTPALPADRLIAWGSAAGLRLLSPVERNVTPGAMSMPSSLPVAMVMPLTVSTSPKMRTRSLLPALVMLRLVSLSSPVVLSP